MNPTESYWMPAESSSVLNPSGYARLAVGVVKGQLRQSLDYGTYLGLLGDRVEKLLEDEDDREDSEQFLLDSLLSANLPDPENLTGRGIVQALSLYLRDLDIPGRLPEEFPPSSRAAQEMHENTNLESWVSNLTNRPTNPDR